MSATPTAIRASTTEEKIRIPRRTRKHVVFFLLIAVLSLLLCFSWLPIFWTIGNYIPISSYSSQEFLISEARENRTRVEESTTLHPMDPTVTPHSSEIRNRTGNPNVSTANITSSLTTSSNSKSSSTLSSTTEQAISYEEQWVHALEPLNVTTGVIPFHFWSGFTNQIYYFLGCVMLLMDKAKLEQSSSTNASSLSSKTAASLELQLLIESVAMKDLFGDFQSHRVRFDFFFDIVHWNSYYPLLPRFAYHNATLFPHVTFRYHTNNTSKLQLLRPDQQWNIQDPFRNATHPIYIGMKPMQPSYRFDGESKSIAKGTKQREWWEILFYKEALQPHPDLRRVMDQFFQQHLYKSPGNLNQSDMSIGMNKTNSFVMKYMMLHARIEPDMQKHPVCRDFKVLRLQDILTSIYKQFPSPVVDKVIITMDINILREEVNRNSQKNDTNSLIARENLDVFNELIAHGMWNRSVPFALVDQNTLKTSNHTVYSKYRKIATSALGYFISQKATIFVGTEISSLSTFITTGRFYKEERENYFYYPRGLQLVTPMNATQPPIFRC